MTGNVLIFTIVVWVILISLWLGIIIKAKLNK